MRGHFSASRVAVLAVVVLVLLDVGLVVGAFASVRPRGGGVSASTAFTPVTSTPSTSKGPTSATQPTSPPTTSSGAVPVKPAATPSSEQQRVLVAVYGSTAWRITSGACGTGGAAIETTSDGGGTWVPRPSPFPVLARVQPTGGTRALVVGASIDCAMGVRQTVDGGQTWSDTRRVGVTWASDAADRTKVRVPVDQTASPCGGAAVLEIMDATAASAQVLCDGGEVRLTVDSGQSWGTVGSSPGAVALDNRVEGGTVTAYVLAPGAGCAGLRVSSVRPGAVAPLGCVGLDPAKVTPGAVSLSVVGDQGWILDGGATWRSRDGLRTWAKL